MDAIVGFLTPAITTPDLNGGTRTAPAPHSPMLPVMVCERCGALHVEGGWMGTVYIRSHFHPDNE